MEIEPAYADTAVVDVDTKRGGGRVKLSVGDTSRVHFRRLEGFHEHSVSFGANCIARGLSMQLRRAGSNVVIGDNFACGSLKMIAYGADIIVGDDVLVSGNVQIRTYDMHAILDAASGEPINPPAPIVIRDKVWIGEGVRIMSGVTIGTNSVIGIGSIVTQDIPSGVIAAGVPARVIRSGITWKR